MVLITLYLITKASMCDYCRLSSQWKSKLCSFNRSVCNPIWLHKTYLFTGVHFTLNHVLSSYKSFYPKGQRLLCYVLGTCLCNQVATQGFPRWLCKGDRRPVDGHLPTSTSLRVFYMHCHIDMEAHTIAF